MIDFSLFEQPFGRIIVFIKSLGLFLRKSRKKDICCLMSDFLTKIWKKVKKYVTKRTILGSAALIGALYYLGEVNTKATEVKLSYFIIGLSKNLISEVDLRAIDPTFDLGVLSGRQCSF